MTGEVNLLPFIPDKGDNKKNIMQNKNIKNYSVSVRLVKIKLLSPLNLKVHSNNCSNGECHYSNWSWTSRKAGQGCVGEEAVHNLLLENLLCSLSNTCIVVNSPIIYVSHTADKSDCICISSILNTHKFQGFFFFQMGISNLLTG